MNDLSLLLLIGGGILALMLFFYVVRDRDRPVVTAGANLRVVTEDRMLHLERRVDHIDESLRQLPTRDAVASKDAVHQLALGQARLEGQVTGIQDTLARQSRTLEHIDTFLRERPIT